MDFDSLARLGQFSDELDSMLLNDIPIVSDETLALFERFFGYPDTCFALYSNRQYYRSVSHSVANLIPEGLFDGLAGASPLSRYIETHPLFFHNVQANVLRYETILAEINPPVKQSGLPAGMPLPYLALVPAPNYCFVVAKSGTDFTSDELELFSRAAAIILKKYRLNYRSFEAGIQDTLKNSVLKNFSIGLLVFNAKYEIVSYNSTFISYLKYQSRQIFATTYFKSLIHSHLPELLPGACVPIYDSSVFSADCNVALSLYTPMVAAPLSERNGLLPENYYLFTAGQPSAACRSHDREVAERASFASHYSLSAREMEIIEAIASGDKYAMIASNLFVSLNTIRTHIKNIYAKLGINNQRALLALYNKYE